MIGPLRAVTTPSSETVCEPCSSAARIAALAAPRWARFGAEARSTVPVVAERGLPGGRPRRAGPPTRRGGGSGSLLTGGRSSGRSSGAPTNSPRAPNRGPPAARRGRVLARVLERGLGGQQTFVLGQ